MTTQNYAVNFLFKTPQQGIEIQKVDANAAGSLNSFKDLLNDKINNNALYNNNSAKSPSKQDNYNDSIDAKEQADQKFKSYKELLQSERNNNNLKTNENKSKVSEVSKEDVDNKKDKKADNAKQKEDLVMQSLANVLGLKPEEFSKLLEKMNIKPEDLADATKIDSIVDKLSNQMDLNEQQKQTLETVIKQVMDAVDKSISSTSDEKKTPEILKSDKNVESDAKSLLEASNNKDSSKGVKLPSDKITVIDNGNKDKDLTEVLNEFKQKLEALRMQLQQNPQKFMGDISDEVKGILAKINASGPQSIETVQTGSVKKDQKNGEVEGLSGKSDKKTSEDTDSKEKVQIIEDKKNAGNIKDDSGSGTKATDLKHLSIDSVKSQDNKGVQFDSFMQNQIQKSSEVNDITKVQKEMPLQKNEILNQVIEKAKVVLTGEKSEMVMDLKPDNLGKLSLKIVTERGMVVAKFVAESQQVKETLEANMQLLKDSLQKQGLSVQGFSVSVNQNPYSGSNMNNNNSNGKNSSNKQENMGNDQMVNVGNVLDAPKTVNPYTWSESKINVTA